MCAVNYSTTFFPQHNAREGSSMKWLFSVSVIFHMSAMIVPDSPPLLTVTSAVHTQASRPQNGQHIRCPGTWDVWLLMGNKFNWSHGAAVDCSWTPPPTGSTATPHLSISDTTCIIPDMCECDKDAISSTETDSTQCKKKKGKEPLEPLQWNITHYAIMNYCNMTVSPWIHSL